MNLPAQGRTEHLRKQHEGDLLARYAANHKAATRQRIVDAASHRFKVDGIDGSGVAVLMSDAGLTNGAFYSHFDSKDDLVANVLASEMAQQVDLWAAAPQGLAGLETAVRSYLSRRHRDERGQGCPTAALLEDIARCGEPVRQLYAEGARTIIDEIAARLNPASPGTARSTASGLYSLVVGTLQLARAVPDSGPVDEILCDGIESALTLARRERRPAD